MSKKNYVKQENHAAEDCRINEKEHSHLGMDCGHAVESGLGVEPQKAVDQRPFCARIRMRRVALTAIRPLTIDRG